MLSLQRAPFRITAPDDEYWTRLVKMIPADVVALYLTFKEVASEWLPIWAWICLGLVFLVRILGTHTDAKSVQWIAGDGGEPDPASCLHGERHQRGYLPPPPRRLPQSLLERLLC